MNQYIFHASFLLFNLVHSPLMPPEIGSQNP
jgi:hypothetical protein